MTITAATAASPFAVPDVSTPLRRLEALAADANLMHTAARWRAHEEVYPGAGATSMIGWYLDRDVTKIVGVRRAVDEFRAASCDLQATRYLEWVLFELTRTDEHLDPRPNTAARDTCAP